MFGSRYPLVLVLTVVVLSGCSGDRPAGDDKRMAQMRDIGMAYHEFLGNSGGAGPQQASDLTPYIKNEDSKALLNSGNIVFLWGVTVLDMAKTPEKSENTVLAHEKDAATKGGAVLYGDGVVKNLSAEEFKKATLAKKQ
jgi:hypothetical protein